MLLNLYHVAYETQEHGKGVAAVLASNPNFAEVVLKTQGRLNGIPNVYKVISVKEIDECRDGEPCLLNEENTSFLD